MPAIITITFSPCIDKSTTVPKLIPEKKLRCASPLLEPGGGGINVARAIKKLGGDATAIFPAGGYTGKYFTALLQKENIPSIVIETQNETRENIIVYEELSGNQYRFGMPGTALAEDEWEKILQTIEEANNVEFIVASGSIPPGVPADIFAHIAFIAKKKNAKFIADTSGEALKQAVNAGVFLLKPNLGELSYLAGKAYLGENDINIAARKLIDSGKCEAVIVSKGSAGALLVTKTTEKQIIPPSVKKVSTVGAGDSMVAGIVYSLHKGQDLETAAQYGVACGTAATLNPGTGLCKVEDVNRLVKIISDRR